MEILDEADVALISVRRRFPTREQLAPLRRFVSQGKPLVGIRTASHAFASRDPSQIPAGRDSWPEFDAQVFGGHYTNHHGNKGEPKTFVQIVLGQQKHPILHDVSSDEFAVPSWLYKTSPVDSKATILMMGRVEKRDPAEPVAWTFVRADGGRSFYTSLGHKDDLTIPSVRRMLVNGIYWAASLPVPTSLRDPKASTLHSPVRSPIESLLRQFRGRLEEKSVPQNTP
jgi:type 1 glutamine amidotransferase